MISARNSRICSTSTVAPKFARLQRVASIGREGVYVCVSDLNEIKQRHRTEWTKLDHVVIAAAIHQWHRRRYLQISDACFVHLLLQYYPHAGPDHPWGWWGWSLRVRPPIGARPPRTIKIYKVGPLWAPRFLERKFAVFKNFCQAAFRSVQPFCHNSPSDITQHISLTNQPIKNK